MMNTAAALAQLSAALSSVWTRSLKKHTQSEQTWQLMKNNL